MCKATKPIDGCSEFENRHVSIRKQFSEFSNPIGTEFAVGFRRWLNPSIQLKFAVSRTVTVTMIEFFFDFVESLRIRRSILKIE